MDDPLPSDIKNKSDSFDSEDSENSENSEEDKKNPNWKIKYEDEVKFWEKLINHGYIYNPNICPVCNIGNFEIKKYNTNNLNKIFYCRCNYNKCRKTIDLRNYSICKLKKNMPASVFFKIIDLFFFDELNAKKITNKIKIKYNDAIKAHTIENILKNFRLIIFNYLQDKYNSTMIGGLDNLNKRIIVAIDESLLLHNSQNEQIWILGGIETKTRKVRLSLTKVRNVNAISNFVYENFYEGTHFVHDSWGGYNFLPMKYMYMVMVILVKVIIALHI